MPWNFTSDAPIYIQVAQIVKLRILRGEYLPGARIPSVRELAQDAGINPNTMQKALELLKAEGLLITQRSTGRTVTECQELIQLTRRALAKGYIMHIYSLGFSAEEIVEMMQETP